MQNKSEIQYGVARGESVVGDLFPHIGAAEDHLRGVNEHLAAVGLESDVRLVEVEVKTSYGRPHAYKAPEVVEEPAE